MRPAVRVALPQRRAPVSWGLARAAVVVGSGYVCAASAVAGLAGLLARLGMARSEAVALALMASPLIYLALLLMAFSTLRHWPAAALLLAAAGLRSAGLG